MQSGEIIVTGSSQVAIALHGIPVRADIFFNDDDDRDIIPACAPTPANTLVWDIDRLHNTLSIRWGVFGIKEIRWRIYYYWNEIPNP